MKDSKFNIDEIKQLSHLFKEYDLEHLELVRSKARITLKASSEEPKQQAPQSSSTPKQPQLAQTDCSTSNEKNKTDYHAIRAPIAGTFYRSADPNSPPFVTEGSLVSPESTLCILEAMKVMNEIKADVSGHIVKICPSNAQSIKKNTLLFLIDKH